MTDRQIIIDKLDEIIKLLQSNPVSSITIRDSGYRSDKIIPMGDNIFPAWNSHCSCEPCRKEETP